MDKSLYVREMFAEIAPRYDATNKLLTAGADEAWRKRAVAELKPPHGGKILDLCCGTGDLAFHLVRTDPSLEVTGADFCAPMLDGRARARTQRRSRRPHVVHRSRRDGASVRRTPPSTAQRWASRCATSSMSSRR